MEPKTFSISKSLVSPVTGRTPGEEFDLGQKKRWRFLISGALVSLLFVFACYLLTASSSILWISIGIWAIGLFAGWRSQKRMQRLRISNAWLEEELILDDEGYHWKQNSPQTLEVHIPWSEIVEIFPGLHIKYGENKKTGYPRIAFGENKEEIMDIIAQQAVEQAGLHKITRNEFEPRDNVYYDNVYYVR